MLFGYILCIGFLIIPVYIQIYICIYIQPSHTWCLQPLPLPETHPCAGNGISATLCLFVGLVLINAKYGLLRLVINPTRSVFCEIIGSFSYQFA